MNSESSLKPMQAGFVRRYLTIDLDQVRKSISRLVSESGSYFSKSLDRARISVLTADGVRREEFSAVEAVKAFDWLEKATLQVHIHFHIEVKGPRGLFTGIPEETIDLAIDFRTRTINLEIRTRGLDKAEQVAKILTEGVVLISFELPQRHIYLQPFLESFLLDHPNPDKNIFLIMRFKAEPPFPEIIRAVHETCATYGLTVLRADDREYTDDLWDNVLTYMYGCDAAVAIFDQINYREFNPNVALEVGFLLAQCKRVLLLKDQAIPVMPADIVGKIYRSFDTYSPANTIPPQLHKWLQDYEIGTPPAS